MRIALTGATGFIGKALLKRLSAEYGSHAITVITSKNIKGFDCALYENNRINLSGKGIECDVLIHAGAYTPKSGVESNDIKGCNSNIVFTQDLLASVNFKVCKKIINLSTLDVYASSELISEKSRLEPVSLYGMSKLYCEKMVHSHAASKNVKAISLRVGHVYGPGEEVYKKVLPVTIAKIVAGLDLEILGDGEDLRSFIHVDDVVESILAAVKIEVKADVVNVVSGNKISIKELVCALVKISGKELQIKHMPSNSAGRDLVFDNRLLKETFLPVEKDFMVGLKDEYDYMVSLNEYRI